MDQVCEHVHMDTPMMKHRSVLVCGLCLAACILFLYFDGRGPGPSAPAGLNTDCSAGSQLPLDLKL